jgi:hypothetical protein
MGSKYQRRKGMRELLISEDGLSMLISSSGAFFTMAYKASEAGNPDAPNRDELRALQIALNEGLNALGQEASPTLQKILQVHI